jgi:2,5-furandicarboxylate decarboxylase 1
VDIFNHSEVLWAIATRCNPAEDVIVVPGTHNHAMDPSLPELGAPGQMLWQRRGGKLIIDATIPPSVDADARAVFERIRPVNGDTVRLSDFAASESMDLVRSLSPQFFGSKLLY